MNKKLAQKILKEIPEINIINHTSMTRFDIINLLNGSNNVGVELGVAKGILAKNLVSSSKFSHYYGIDAYSTSGHNTSQYIESIQHIGHISNIYRPLRAQFDECVNLFDDEYFDFIYIDGFAHTGEEGGQSIIDWIPKLKVGGIIAGDDYSPSWPLVIWAVNNICFDNKISLNVASNTLDTDYCRYPSWFFKKETHHMKLVINDDLYKIAMKEKARVNRIRNINAFIHSLRLKASRLKKLTVLDR